MLDDVTKAYIDSMTYDAQAARIEDLEEALRLIVTMLAHDPKERASDRDEAVMVVALDALGIDEEPVLDEGRLLPLPRPA